uniref:Metallophos domain-containing protein n=1 Tax=Macrostomum lignano TaxID=282301 RepID=A0A1I8FCN6_9PLAT
MRPVHAREALEHAYFSGMDKSAMPGRARAEKVWRPQRALNVVENMALQQRPQLPALHPQSGRFYRGSDRAAYTAPESGTVPIPALLWPPTPSRHVDQRRRRRQLRRRRGRRAVCRRRFLTLLAARLLAAFSGEYPDATMPPCSPAPGRRWPGESPLAPTSRSMASGDAAGDTHLLWAGGRATELRREWQMERAFQTSLFLHRPRLLLSRRPVRRRQMGRRLRVPAPLGPFSRMFRVPDGTRLLVVAGNHDIGFHYDVTQHKVDRFEAAFHLAAVQLVSIGGVNFVLANRRRIRRRRLLLCDARESSWPPSPTGCAAAFGIRLGDACRKRGKPSERRSAAPATAPILLTHYRWPGSNESACDTSLRLPKGPPPPQATVATKSRSSMAKTRARAARQTGSGSLDCLSAEASDTLARLSDRDWPLSTHALVCGAASAWPAVCAISPSTLCPASLAQHQLPASYCSPCPVAPTPLPVPDAARVHGDRPVHLRRAHRAAVVLWPCLLSLAASVCWHCASFFTAQAPWRQADDKHL